MANLSITIKILPAINELHCYGNYKRGIGNSLAGLVPTWAMFTRAYMDHTFWVCKCACMLRWFTQLMFLSFMTSSSINLHNIVQHARSVQSRVVQKVQLVAVWHLHRCCIEGYSVHFWTWVLLGWPYGLVMSQKCIAFHKWIQQQSLHFYHVSTQI